MLGIYNYTVILTYIGMLFGFTGITCTINGNVRGSVLCLMAAGVCDMFDGRIASTMERTKREKRFGIQIDSLSDLVCFGILPALIIYTENNSPLRLFPSAVYVLCALIRLAWFNVDEEERQDHNSGRRSVYYGLPVTFAALILPAVMCFSSKYYENAGRIGSLTLLIMSAAFLTPFQLKKPSLSRSTFMLLIGILSFAAVAAGGMDV